MFRCDVLSHHSLSKFIFTKLSSLKVSVGTFLLVLYKSIEIYAKKKSITELILGLRIICHHLNIKLEDCLLS